MSMHTTAMFLEALENVRDNIYQKMQKQGFWEPPHDNVASKLALIHSEISEALEAHRKPHPEFKTNETIWTQPNNPDVFDVRRSFDKEYPKPEGFGIELADAVIRILDLCGYLNIDLGRCILDKMEYNDKRPFKHGKEF